jgi:hypothetical protein
MQKLRDKKYPVLGIFWGKREKSEVNGRVFGCWWKTFWFGLWFKKEKTAE